jgi:hypothetical protein
MKKWGCLAHICNNLKEEGYGKGLSMEGINRVVHKHAPENIYISEYTRIDSTKKIELLKKNKECTKEGYMAEGWYYAYPDESTFEKWIDACKKKLNPEKASSTIFNSGNIMNTFPPCFRNDLTTRAIGRIICSIAKKVGANFLSGQWPTEKGNQSISYGEENFALTGTLFDLGDYPYEQFIKKVSEEIFQKEGIYSLRQSRFENAIIPFADIPGLHDFIYK